MEWQHPQWLYLILPLAVGLAGAVTVFARTSAAGGRGVRGPGDVVADSAAGFTGPVLGEIGSCAKRPL